MFTTRSRSGNSKRWGTSASRSFGPMSGSSLMAAKIQSMTVRNSLGDENSAAMAQEDDERRGERELAERVDRVPVDRGPVDFARVLVDRARVLLADFAADFEAALRARVVPVLLAAADRDAVDREAVVRDRAVLAALASSAATRARRLSTSRLRSSRTFRSAMASRKRAAAWATSSTRSRPR